MVDSGGWGVQLETLCADRMRIVTSEFQNNANHVKSVQVSHPLQSEG